MSVANMPTLIPEVAFATTPADPSPTWVNVLADFRAASTTRGRQRELDRYQAGRLDMVLNNRGRAYDPEYSAGPYYPNVKPMRRTQLRATWNAVTYPVIDAYTDKWDQNYTQPREATATLRATDGFKVLTKKQLPVSAYAAEVLTDAPTHWWRLGDASGSTVAVDSGSAPWAAAVQSAVTFGTAGLISHDPDSAMTMTGESVIGGGLTVDNPTSTISGTGPFSIEMLVHFNTLTTSAIRSLFNQQGPGDVGTYNTIFLGTDQAPNAGQVLWRITNNGGALTQVHSTATLTAGVTYHIVATFTSSAAKIYIDGIDVSSVDYANYGTIDQAPRMWIGGIGEIGFSASPDAVIDEVAIYNAALSAARVAAHNTAARTPWQGDTPATRLGRVLDAVAWPAALRNLDTGSSTLQSATLGQTALDHAQKVADSEFGELFMTRDGNVRLVGRTGLLNRASAGTFGDGPGELTYTNIGYDNGDQLIRNPVTVSRTGGVAQTSTDTTGTTEYLAHQYTLDGLYHDSDTLSRDAANFLVSEYKDPKTRVVSLTIDPLRNPTNLWPVVLGAELGDVLTVIRRPQGVGSAISQVCEIQGISHTITPNSWTVTFTLSPAYTGAFLQLDLMSGPGLDSLRLYF